MEQFVRAVERVEARDRESIMRTKTGEADGELSLSARNVKVVGERAVFGPTLCQDAVLMMMLWASRTAGTGSSCLVCCGVGTSL
jgi:hypothetical protein